MIPAQTTSGSAIDDSYGRQWWRLMNPMKLTRAETAKASTKAMLLAKLAANWPNSTTSTSKVQKYHGYKPAVNLYTVHGFGVAMATGLIYTLSLVLKRRTFKQKR